MRTQLRLREDVTIADLFEQSVHNHLCNEFQTRTGQSASTASFICTACSKMQACMSTIHSRVSPLQLPCEKVLNVVDGRVTASDPTSSTPASGVPVFASPRAMNPNVQGDRLTPPEMQQRLQYLQKSKDLLTAECVTNVSSGTLHNPHWFSCCCVTCVSAPSILSLSFGALVLPGFGLRLSGRTAASCSSEAARGATRARSQGVH